MAAHTMIDPFTSHQNFVKSVIKIDPSAGIRSGVTRRPVTTDDNLPSAADRRAAHARLPLQKKWRRIAARPAIGCVFQVQPT